MGVRSSVTALYHSRFWSKALTMPGDVYDVNQESYPEDLLNEMFLNL